MAKVLSLFGIVTGKEILECGYTYNMTVIPNARYEIWVDELNTIKKTVNVKTGLELK